MGTLEEMADHELEGEILVSSSSPSARKMQTFETSHCAPMADVAHAWNPKRMRGVAVGTLEEMADHELEGEILLNSSSPTARKMQTFETSHCASMADVAHAWTPKRMRSRLLVNISIVLFKAKINVLLPFGPLAVLLHYLTGKHGQGWVFFFSLLGIAPLAERLGYATEQLAYYTGPTVGGLLNATFGNATEMIISLYALKQGMIRVVQQSLLGSILSNMLLVLGCAFFIGGIVNNKKDQVFNKLCFNSRARSCILGSQSWLFRGLAAV